MENDVELEKKGYSTTTYSIHLFCKEIDWVELTIEYYNKIIEFYYEYLFNHSDLLSLTNHHLLRELEIRTIGEKKKDAKPDYPFPFSKVPLYFRRSAINSSIRMARIYFTQLGKWETKERNLKPMPAKQFHISPIYYKGMYRNLTENSIELKLWSGEKWVWRTYEFPTCDWIKEKNILSPTLKLYKRKVMLLLPVISKVSDIRTLQERLKEKEKIAAIAFPNNNSLAVIVILGREERYEGCFFIKGEKELSHKRNYIMGKIKKAKGSMKDTSKGIKDYPKYREELLYLIDSYAHLVSRKAVNYCVEHQVKIIVVPQYKEGIDFQKLSYLNVSQFAWIGRRIIQYIRYKAFQEGILVTSVSPAHISDHCHICGEVIRKYNSGYYPSKNFYGGKWFVCENGHQGNSAFNTAMNIANKFIKNKMS